MSQLWLGIRRGKLYLVVDGDRRFDVTRHASAWLYKRNYFEAVARLYGGKDKWQLLFVHDHGEEQLWSQKISPMNSLLPKRTRRNSRMSSKEKNST